MSDKYKFETDANYYSSNTREDGDRTVIIGSKGSDGSQHEHYNIKTDGSCDYARDGNGKEYYGQDADDFVNG